MPTEEEAERAVAQVAERAAVPEGWSVNTFVDLPEPAVDETDQWVVGEIHHDEYDKMVSLWLLSDDEVQPYFDGYAHADEGEWGEVYYLPELETFPLTR